MKKLMFILIILFLPLLLIAQDKIYLKNGKVISCKIISEDTLNVFIEIEKNESQIMTFVKKDEVLSILPFRSKKYNSNISSDINPDFIPPEIFTTTEFNNFESLSISYGLSYPMGAFGSLDLSSDKSGFASNGTSLSISYNKFFESGFGVNAKIFFNWNDLNLSVFSRSFMNETGISINASTSDYKSKGFLIGPIFRYPLICNFSIEGHFLIGLSNLKESEILLSHFPYSSKLSEVQANSYMINLGVGLNYSIFNSFDFFAVLDYMTASYKLGDLKITNSEGLNQSVSRGTQLFGVVNTSIGLNYKF